MAYGRGRHGFFVQGVQAEKVPGTVPGKSVSGEIPLHCIHCRSYSYYLIHEGTTVGLALPKCWMNKYINTILNSQFSLLCVMKHARQGA